eukprot:CAMPEP_0172835048 /NCGR_PEP_ID=MMETSP1075-20121228/25464_1 /TAXON_ID=2916 /ORGANISM="Ceratium fusus, Strain PA161109" /LENGTH=288 /DNA_ID=CAMNT_0013678033 /DNA_START=51 /DNA_END=917 /DNA_ORIENTATION=-
MAKRLTPGTLSSSAAPVAGSILGTAGRVVEMPAALLVTPLQVRWARKKKRAKAPKRGDRTPEQKAAAGGQKPRIFDNVMDAETPHAMSMTIRAHMRGLASDGRHNIRRKKDLSRYTSYRVMRIAGLTHDGAEEEDIDRRGFVTPLTQLQDRSHLPRSAVNRRFHFPHTFNYKVYWGPPSVQPEPNKYEGSMVGCSVAVRLHDLPLTQRQKERLVAILGPNRIDANTGVIALEVDDFPERNQNAALLGDMLEDLLREAIAADAPAPLRPPAVVSGGLATPRSGRGAEEE